MHGGSLSEINSGDQGIQDEWDNKGCNTLVTDGRNGQKTQINATVKIYFFILKL